MKTPEQIARETFAKMHSQAAKECENEILGHIVEGIKADRAERDIIAQIEEILGERSAPRIIIDQIAEILDDRGAHAAAQLVRYTDPDGDLWNNYISPMIDSIEDDYTRMAKEINA